MAKQYRTALIIEGDAKGGINAIQATEKELGQLNRRFDRSGKRAKRFSKDVRDTGDGLKVLKRAAAGVGTALAAAFAANNLANQARFIAQTDALAQSLQVNTTTLQQWQYAGQQVGLEADKIGDIFKDVSDKIGDFAATGGGEAADLFENLNLDIRELQRLAPDQQILKIADAVNQLEDPSQRTFYLESLGDEMVRLQPLLADNGRLLRQYADEAQELGVAMSSIELEQARDADRALKQIGAAVDGLTNQLLVDFAPAIVATAEQVKALAQSADEIKAPFAEFATQSRLVAQDVAQSFAALDRYVIETFGGWGSDGRDAAEFISDAFRNLPANIKAMVELGTVELLTLVEKAQAYGIAIDKYLNPQNWLNGSWGSIGEELDKALGQVDQTRLASITGVLDERQRILEAYDIEQQADRQAASLKQLENNARAFTASLATSTAQQQASTTTSQAATQQASQQAQALEALRQGVDPLRAAHADYTDNLAVLNRALADGTIGQQEYVEAVRWAAQQYQEAATGAAAQSQRLDELARQYDGQHQRAQRLEQAVADLNAAYRAGDISGAQYQRMLANVRDEMARTAQDADPLAQEMARAWDEAANRIDETFASAFQGAFDSFDDFSGQLLDGFKTLLAELAYQATLKPIVVGITSDVQGALGLPGQGGASTSSGLGQLSSLGSSLSVGGLQTAGNAYRAFAGTGSTYGGQFGASLAATGNGGLASGINSLAASGLGSAALGVGGGLAGGYLGTQAGESLFGKQANSNYGALAGAALGQTFIPIPGVGAALGGFAGGALDSLFGSDREYGFRFAQRAENPKAAGVDAGYDTDPRYGWYSSGGYQNGDLGRGRSTAFGSYGFLSKEVAEPDDLIAFLDSLETLDNTIAGALDDDQIARIKDELNGYYYKGDSLQRVLRERLDIIVDQSNSAFEASLERLGGDVETQVQALVSSLRVDDLGTGMAASVADEIDAQFRQALASGDSQIIAAAADRLASAAQAVQVLGDSAERLSLQFDAAASGALSAADNVAQLVGGMDSLSALQSRYFEAFYSDDEQLEALGQALREQFDALGLALPQTRTGVRDLVEGIDLMTEAGQRQYATVLEMVPSLERYVQQMQQQGQVTQQQTAALREQQGIAKSVALGRVARSAFEALEQSVQQEKEVLQSAYEQTTQRITGNIDRINAAMQEAQGIAASLDSALGGMRLSSQRFEREQRASAQGYLRDTLAGSGLGDPQRLEQALAAVSEPSQQLFGSFEAYARDYYTTVSVVDQLQDRAETQVDNQEAAAKALERQLDQAETQHRDELARLDATLGQGQAQLNALLGIDDSVLSVAAAMSNLQSAIASSVAASGGSSGGYDDEGDALLGGAIGPVADAYRDILGRSPDDSGYAYWNDRLASGTSIARIREEIAAQRADGYHANGLADVPFDGYRAVLHRGEDVLPASIARLYRESAPGGGSQELLAEIRRLNQQVERLQAYVYQTTKNTGKTSKLMQRWDGDGLPATRGATA